MGRNPEVQGLRTTIHLTQRFQLLERIRSYLEKEVAVVSSVLCLQEEGPASNPSSHHQVVEEEGEEVGHHLLEEEEEVQ